MFDGVGIGALAFLGLAIITVLAGAKMVPQGHNWTVERFATMVELPPWRMLLVKVDCSSD